jgi:acetyltransferase-like isoleucine patch superfamily enzyme
MKSFVKFILYTFAKPLIYLFYTIYSYRFSRKVRVVSDIFYTLWIRNNIKKFGKRSKICKDCSLRGGQYIEIGDFTYVGRHGVITCWDIYMDEKLSPSIKIGNNCSIGEYCHITSVNSIIIGNWVLMGRRITITDNSHGKNNSEEKDIPPIQRKLYSKGTVIIEDNVWIGDKVSIMSGVRVGKGAVIAANAVVTKDVPAYSVVGGIPAKVIKNIEDENSIYNLFQ